MREYTVREIAQIVGGELIAGDGETTVTEFSTNSKEGNAATMFVPVIGERVDGHDFIGDAFAHGMRAAFTCRKDIVLQTCDKGYKDENAAKNSVDSKNMAYVYIDLPEEKNPNVAALQRLGAYVRGTFPIPVIGITGSVGKTSTKEMVASALATKFCTLKTDGNMNSQIGVPRMMLRFTKEHEIAVIEMGMSMPGEMERIVRVARPECAVITNISVSHIENLGSMTNILNEKLNIINEIPDGGVLFLNGDDRMLRKVADIWRICGQKAQSGEKDKAETGGIRGEENAKDEQKNWQELERKEEDEPIGISLSSAAIEKLSHIRVIIFGTGADCDYHAKNIQTAGDGMQFTLCGNQLEHEFDVKLSVVGQHNVLNALAAFAVAAHYGIAPEHAAGGLFHYQPLAMRGGKIKVGGAVLIDDTYNASPESIRAALDGLAAVKAKRHIAVLGDMLELGEMSKTCHTFVGESLISFHLDCVVGVGKDAEYYVKGALQTQEESTILGRFFSNNASALAFLKEFVQEGDAVLFKGSRGMKLEEIVAGLAAALTEKEKNRQKEK